VYKRQHVLRDDKGRTLGKNWNQAMQMLEDRMDSAEKDE
jgi:hypothetical protein